MKNLLKSRLKLSVHVKMSLIAKLVSYFHICYSVSYISQVKSDHREHSGDDEVDHIKKELQFDLNHPLKHALRSVFKNGGKVLLAFPGSSIAQVSYH